MIDRRTFVTGAAAFGVAAGTVAMAPFVDLTVDATIDVFSYTISGLRVTNIIYHVDDMSAEIQLNDGGARHATTASFTTDSPTIIKEMEDLKRSGKRLTLQARFDKPARDEEVDDVDEEY